MGEQRIPPFRASTGDHHRRMPVARAKHSAYDGSMEPDAAALALIERIYAAAYEPERWHDYALALCDAAEATSVSFIVHSPLDATASIHTELTGTAAQHRAYETHFSKVDKWREAGARAAPGAVWLSHELIDEREFAESEFYRDFLRHSDGKLFHFAGGPVPTDGSTLIVSGVLREQARGPFGEAQRRLMTILAPHLRQAVQLDRRLRALRHQRDTAAAVAGRVSQGVILLDARGRILAMNAAAEDIVLAGDGLTIAGGLAAMRAADDTRLQGLIRRAATRAGGGAMALPRPSGRRPYWLVLAPGAGDAARDPWDGERPAAVLFISDPERRPSVPTEALRQQYGLTRQEARVAVAMAEGRSMAEIATLLRIARGTAEIHLKRTMRKLDVHSRAELVALLLRGNGSLVWPD